MSKDAHRILFRSIILFAGITLSVVFSPHLSLAQHLLNNPESVVYDSLYDRYLVSNFPNWSNSLLRKNQALKIDAPAVASNKKPLVGILG